jgi:hypothetical protein
MTSRTNHLIRASFFLFLMTSTLLSLSRSLPAKNRSLDGNSQKMHGHVPWIARLEKTETVWDKSVAYQSRQSTLKRAFA